MSLTEQLSVPLNALMMICYRMVGHYLAAILIFTLLTKVILFPVSLWTHRNGITMIRLMPELNRLKVKYYGDKHRRCINSADTIHWPAQSPCLSSLHC